MNYRELLVGCGHSRTKRVTTRGEESWLNLTTLDMYPECKPDVVHNLNDLPLPFDDNTFDEIHAYEVLEHCGRQGDFRFFLAQFEDFWRILKGGGILVASVPAVSSPWLWGDPGHSRVVLPESLVFLSQESYKMQVGITAMSDYRSWYRGDFQLVTHKLDDMLFYFVLKALKGEK